MTASSTAAVDVLLDSAGFLALWDAGDEHHGRAVRLQTDLAGRHRRFVTTEYVVDETVTLLLVRHSHAAAAVFLDTEERSESLRLEWIGPDRFHAAAVFFRRHADVFPTRVGMVPPLVGALVAHGCARRRK